MKYLIVLVIVAGIVGLMIQYPHTMLSPGELTQGHQDLSNDCFACHTPFGGIQNDKCIACHKLSEIGMNPKPGQLAVSGNSQVLFHEKLASQSCMACHTDHKGVEPNRSLGNFEHSLIAENLINNCVSCHQKPVDNLHKALNTNCNACHNTEDWKLSAKFDHNMVMETNRNNCVSCHENPDDTFHQSLKGNCGQCHSTDKWVPATFDHDAYFILDRDHNVHCSVCHKDKNYSTYTCYGCHEHTVSNILSEHNEEGIYNITNCVSCHRSAEEDDIRSHGDYKQAAPEGGKKENKSKKEKDDDD